MDLKSLLHVEGDPLKPILYALAYAFVGASGPLVVALQYGDYIWAADDVVFATTSTLAVFGAAYAMWALFGKRVPAWVGLAIAVIVGCLAAQVLQLYLIEQVVGIEPHAGKGYL